MMSKPKYIQANYSQTIEFNLEEIGVDWDKVKDFSIKDGILSIYYKDDTEESFTNCSNYSENIFSVFDKDWEIIKRGNDE
tara:strand:- start:53 stop:292 length:240 start_codon:yes stop_codon:yes gene_type:complete